jgi:Fe-S-cluster containining protein
MSDPYHFGERKCTVYEARPTMCRVFGHVPEMSCILGYNVNVDPRVVHGMIKESGAMGKAMLLHEALLEFEVSTSLLSC